jgi:anti-sigma B factor antagonist
MIQRAILDDMAMASIRQDLLQQLDGHEVRDVVLNFRKVEYISSGALGMLMTLHQRLNQLGGRLILCNVAAGIAEVFELFKLDRVFTISDEDIDVEGDDPNLDDPGIGARLPPQRPSGGEPLILPFPRPQEEE